MQNQGTHLCWSQNSPTVEDPSFDLVLEEREKKALKGDIRGLSLLSSLLVPKTKRDDNYIHKNTTSSDLTCP